MNDMTSIVNAVTRVTFILLSVFLLVWAFAPEYRPIAAGLTLGTAIGLINVRYLSMKVQQLVDLAVSAERKRYNFGMVTRMCIAFLAVMIAAKLGHVKISLPSTIVGLFIAQLLTIPVSIFFGIRQNK